MNAVMKMMGIPTAHVMADFISIVVTSVLTVIIYKKVKNQLKQRDETDTLSYIEPEIYSE